MALCPKHATLPLAATLLSSPALAQERDYPIRPVPFTSVGIECGFWSPRLETNRTVTVWYDFEKCEETGRIANFAKAFAGRGDREDGAALQTGFSAKRSGSRDNLR